MTLRLTVSPKTGPLWQRRSIRVSGARPGALVTLVAETERNGVPWASRVVLLADTHGRVDLATDAPVSGDFRVADPMGVFWAQHREAQGGPQPEPIDPTIPVRTRLTATSDGQASTVDVSQWLVADGVTRRDVREDGLVGSVYTPADPGPHPTVIVLNGSGGGLNEARAAVYASRGIQAFALGYFRAPGLTDYISRTPLELFERALTFSTAALNPLGGRPFVSGQSRGGELTLQLASMFPDRVAGIVPVVPLHLRSSAQGAADPLEGWDSPTWTWRGEPLEYLFDGNTAVTWQPWSGGPPPSRHSDVYVTAMDDPQRVAASRIEIERFRGPVATVSGQDDRAWPSSWAARSVMATLDTHGHNAERLLLDYEDAGHSITIPYMPATEIDRIHPVSGVRYSNGGTPRGNAFASADSFERICDFIHRNTENHTTQGSKG